MSDHRYSPRNQYLRAGIFALPLLPIGLTEAMYEGSMPHGFGGWGALTGLWLLGVAVYVGLVVVHELGHALAGAAMGIEIAEITIGHWKKIGTFRLGSVLVRLRAIPDSGYVVPKPSLNLLSAPRYVSFVSAGMAAELAVIVGFAFLVPVPEFGLASVSDVVIAYVRVCVLWFGGLTVLFSARPNDERTSERPNDGKLLLNFWRTRGQRGAERGYFIEWSRLCALTQSGGCAAALPEAEKLLQKAPHQHSLKRWIALAYAETGDTDKTLVLFNELLERPGLGPRQRAEVLDWLARMPLYYGRTDLLEKAQSWIDAALLLAPYAITLKSTKGGLLVEAGRIEEGAALLHEVFKKSDDDLDRAIALAYLAKAAGAKGNRTDAARLMAQAQAIAPDQRVVRRVAASLAERGDGPSRERSGEPPA